MIELPGHEVILPRTVFAQLTSDFKAMNVTVVYLYDEPRPSAIWDHLLSEVEGLAAIKNFGYEPKSELEKLVYRLPEEILNNFAVHKEEYFEYCSFDFKERSRPKRTLQIAHGAMPLEVLAEGNGDPNWYLKRLFELRGQDDSDEKDYQLGERVYIALALNKKGLPPPRERVTEWICREAALPQTLQIIPDEYDPEEVLPLVNRVYDALEVGDLKDLRILNELENYAVSAMKGILAVIKLEENMRKREPST